MKLKKEDAKDNKLFNVIDAHSKETKSKSAPENVKTFLLYIPKQLHKKLKIAATSHPDDLGLHDYIIRKLEELHADR